MVTPALEGSCGWATIGQFVASAAAGEPSPNNGLPRFDGVLPWR